MYTGLESINFRKISVISACVFIFGVIFGYVVFPITLKKLLKTQIHLKPNSMIRGPYTKAPFGIDFRVYMFNLTNKEEVAAGGKPKVQEVGPYFFEEWKEKYDLEDDEVEDTLKYHFKNTFIFRKDLSLPLTGDEIITMPHPLITAMSLAINVERKPMLPLVSKGIEAIFHPTDAFWTGKVMDILYRGIKIDCSSTEFAATAICSAFAGGEAKAVRPIDEKTYAFSFFDSANGTDIGLMEVFRGKKNVKDIGRVISFNGEPEMDVWPTLDDNDECNKYVGTDSTIFPPFVKPEDPLFAYEPTICRSLAATYVRPSKYGGIPTKRYELDLDNPVNKKMCFCRFPPDGCPPAGTFDLYHCAKAPMLGSMPHFYGADPALREKFASGIEPNETKHSIYLDFETITGSPLHAARRLQFNLEIVPVPEVPVMKDLQSMLYPLFWVEESVALNKTWTAPLKDGLYMVITLKNAIKWLCIILGLVGMIVGAALHHKFQSNSITVTAPVSKTPTVESVLNSAHQHTGGPMINGIHQKA